MFVVESELTGGDTLEFVEPTPSARGGGCEPKLIGGFATGGGEVVTVASTDGLAEVFVLVSTGVDDE